MPGRLHVDRDVVLDGNREERRRVDLEVGDRRRDRSRYECYVSVHDDVKWNPRIMRGLAGTFDLQIRVDRVRERGPFRQLCPHRDDRKLTAPRCLQNVQVAVTVTGIKGFDRHRDQKVTTPGLTSPPTSRRMAHAIDLVQRM